MLCAVWVCEAENEHGKKFIRFDINLLILDHS